LPIDGDWSLSITVRHGSDTAEFTLPLEVVKSDAGFALPWDYMVLLVFAAVLLLAYWRRHRVPAAVRDYGPAAAAIGDRHADQLELTRKTP